MDVVDISSSVEHDQIEPTLCRIPHHIGANVSRNKIEACHRLVAKTTRALSNFPVEKIVSTRCLSKKGSEDLHGTDLDLPAGTELYVNDSLFPYYRGLWNETKKLWNKKKNFSYFAVNGTVMIRL